MYDGKDNYSYSYDQFNSITETKKNGNVVETYSYDANGNETKDVSKKDINGTQIEVTSNYGYDKADRLTNLTISDGTITKNIYNTFNGDGQRKRQKEDGVTTKYYFDGNYSNMYFFYNYVELSWMEVTEEYWKITKYIL
jgi:uncharacterized protein RhaS with RHS repeats